MKSLKSYEKIIYLILGAAIIALISFVAFPQSKAPTFGAVAFITKATNASTSVSSATLVLGANGARLAATICNATGTGNTLYLNFQKTATTTGVGVQGVALNGGLCYRINQNNLWTGPIYGFDTATTTATTLDEQ